MGGYSPWSPPPPVAVAFATVARTAAEADVEGVLRRPTLRPCFAVVELEQLHVVLSTVDATSLVSKHDVDFDPLRDVPVVTDADALRRGGRLRALSLRQASPGHLMLPLEAEDRAVHALHHATHRRVDEGPPPLLLGGVARGRLRTLLGHVLSRCVRAGDPEVPAVGPQREVTVGHPRRADEHRARHRSTKPRGPQESGKHANEVAVDGEVDETEGFACRPVLERDSANNGAAHHASPPCGLANRPTIARKSVPGVPPRFSFSASSRAAAARPMVVSRSR